MWQADAWWQVHIICMDASEWLNTCKSALHIHTLLYICNINNILLIQSLACRLVRVYGEYSTQVTPWGRRVETLHLAEDGVWA